MLTQTITGALLAVTLAASPLGATSVSASVRLPAPSASECWARDPPIWVNTCDRRDYEPCRYDDRGYGQDSGGYSFSDGQPYLDQPCQPGVGPGRDDENDRDWDRRRGPHRA